MSAMAKMFTDMIMKELPDEIRQALTPENMEKVAQGLVHKWTFIEGSFNAILTNQEDILKKLENLERLDNDNCSSDGSGTIVALPTGDGSRAGSPRSRRRASGD